MSTEENTGSNQNGIEYEHLLLVSLIKKAHELSKGDSRFKNFAIGRQVKIGYRKLDDIVFRYEANDDQEKPEDGNIPKRKLIFGQIKHKKDSSLKINHDHLTKAKMSGNMGADFNLQQYFISFRTIRKELENEQLSEQLKNGKIKYTAIFTNVDIDKEHLEDKGCSLKEAPADIKDLFALETNHFHQFGNVSDDLKNIFKKSSDLHIIAREFAHFVVSKKYEGKKEFIMGSNKAKYHYIIKKYHVALGKEVITKTEKKNIKNEIYYVAKFKEDFIGNEEPGSKKELRDAIFEAIRELDELKKDLNEDKLKDIIRSAEWKVESYFGGKNLPDSWMPNDLGIVAREFAHFVVSKKSEQQEEEFIMGLNKAKCSYIIKYHVALGKEVITKTEKKNGENEPYYASFFQDFIDNQEPGSKKELRDAIFKAIEQLDESKKDLSEDELKDILRNAEWKVESYFGGKNLPATWVPVVEEDIDYFLECLVFSVNQPNVIDLLTQISSEKEKNFFLKFTPGGEALDIMDEKFKDRLLKALGIPRREENWITGKQIEEFIEEQQEALNCTIYTLLYEDKTMQYGEFNKIEIIKVILDSFLSSEKNEKITRTYHSQLKKAKILCFHTTMTLLTTVKILQYLNSETKKAENCRISIKLEDLKTETFANRVEKAFKSGNLNLLTVECTGDFKEKPEWVIDLYCRFTNIIKDNPNKKILLITEINYFNTLTERIKDYINKFPEKHKQISDPRKLCVHKIDDIVVKDFKPKEDPFAKKIIVFQGQKEEISLATLTGIPNWQSYAADSSPNEIQNEEDIIDAVTLVEILKGESIIVGSRLQGTDSLECAYASLPEEVKEIKKGNLVKKLLQQGPDSNTDAIYIVSGILGSNGNEKMEKLIQYLGLVNKKEIIKKQLGNIGSNSRIQITNDQFGEENIKDICRNHPTKEIFWIDIKDDKAFSLHKPLQDDSYDDTHAVLFKEITKETLANKLLCPVSDSNNNDIYIVSGMLASKKNKKLQKLMDYLGLICEKEEIERHLGDIGSGSRIQVASDTFIDKDFKAICRKHPEKEIFWICIKDENKFLLEKFYNPSFYLKIVSKNELKELPTGPASNFLEYTEESKTTSVQEENLIKQIRNSKTVIIVGDPGTGKTVELTKFYETKYESISFIKSLWIIRVNLRNHGLAVKNIKTEKRIIDVVNFMLEIDSELNNSLSKSLLINALHNNTISKPLLLVVDGFDEVFNNEARENIISLLKFIKEETPSKLWVSSRRHYKEALEKGLSAEKTIRTELKHMNDDSAIAYIQKYLKDRFCLILTEENFAKNNEKQENKSVQKYAEAFLKKVKSIFEDDMSEFVGTPLLFHLMLNDSEIHFKNWIEGNVDQNLTFNYLDNDVEVYEKLIKGMCNFSHEKYRDVTDEMFWNGHEYIFLQYTQKIAECFIFKSKMDDIFEEKSQKDIQDIVFLTGIIKSDGSSIEFFPSKLKYFYAAKLCVDLIKERKNPFTNREKNKYILKVILKKPDYKQIRNIINVKLNNAMETNEFKKCLKYYGPIIEELLVEEESSLIDEKGTALHVAVAEGNKNIVQFLLESLKGHAVALNKFLVTLDKNGSTSLSLAQYKNDVEIAKLLSDAEAELKEVTGNPINAQRKEVSN